MKYLDKKYINEIVCNSLNINKEEIKKIVSMGGMTNRNFKVFIKDTWYALRIPTPGTGDMINRKEEYNNIIYANKIGLDSDLIYFNKGTRVKISKFIENSEALNLNSSKKKIEFYGIEIKAIDALNDDKNKTIILIANKKNSQEMYNYAMKLGFKNVIDVSEYI